MKSEWEAYIAEFEEQQRLEKYQRERLLKRPKTTKLTVGIHIALFLLSLFSVMFFIFIFTSLSIMISLLIFSMYVIVLTEIYGRFIAIKMVECYQHYASEEKRRSCKCVPSCSEYAIACLKKYAFLTALLKIRKRLFVTCKGFSYIIDQP